MKVSLTEENLRQMVNTIVKSVLSEKKNTDVELLRQRIEGELKELEEYGFHPIVEVERDGFRGVDIICRFPDEEIKKICFNNDDYWKFLKDTMSSKGFMFDGNDEEPEIARWIYRRKEDALDNAKDVRNKRFYDNMDTYIPPTPEQAKLQRKKDDLRRKLYPSPIRKGRNVK